MPDESIAFKYGIVATRTSLWARNVRLATESSMSHMAFVSRSRRRAPRTSDACSGVLKARRRSSASFSRSFTRFMRFERKPLSKPSL